MLVTEQKEGRRFASEAVEEELHWQRGGVVGCAGGPQ